MASVTVIDYGVSNLLNVVRALEHCGADVIIADDPAQLETAERLVLPGVGAFADGMDLLRRRSMGDAICRYVETERPFLGICLGMQMMFDTSSEFGRHAGLGLIRGAVVEIPGTGLDGRPHKIPHIGWTELCLPPTRSHWNSTLFEAVDPGAAMYFVHSFMAVPTNEDDRLADCLYDGVRISAAIQVGNVFGCQFHPEKSGELGLQILRTFMEW